MRYPTRRCFAGLPLVALALASMPGTAKAQTDLNPPLPDVLLLVDTSGSMEYQTDGSPVTCNPGTTTDVNDRSRWIDVVETLTGTIENYTCQSISRQDASFNSGEYALNGGAYDYHYPIPYHRPLSGSCAPAPGSQSTNPFIYPSGAISYHTYNGSTPCTFSQPGNDGVLDVYQDYVRFALMTFDTAVDSGTGFDGTLDSSPTLDLATGKAGLWSYVIDSSGKQEGPPSNPARGKPAGCSTNPVPEQEVGSRNAAAPPWEGRMVSFGNPYDGERDYVTRNRHIQEVLLATRPYGGTPIAGMLHDAQDFLLNDTSTDPDRYPTSLDASKPEADFGPYRDPFLECRDRAIILLTDGQPNLDLRPYCADDGETPAGVCPFALPEETADQLLKKGIKTYVMGFALDKVDDDNDPTTAAKDCNAIDASDVDTTDATSLCNKPENADNHPLQACCTLQRIALAGGTTAFFSSTKTELRSQISSILSTHSVSSRTRPAAVSSGGAGGSFRFFTGFKPGGYQEPWTGKLKRQRFDCEKNSGIFTAAPQDIDPASGDDFVHNVAVGGPDARRVYTVVGGASVTDPIDSLASIRPNIGTTDPDGVGTYGGRYFSGTSSSFISGLPPDTLAIPTTSCVDKNGVALATTSDCRDLYLKWWLGYDNGQGVKSRCPTVGSDDCQLVGDILHSTPIIVNHPSTAIRDESYARFEYVQAKRPMVLYASTNDGLLHAFKVTSNDPAEFDDDAKMVKNDGQSNELWTFVPPEVLPNIYHLYPYNHQVLLDGTAVWQDVVAIEPTDSTEIPTVFERSAAAAQDGSAAWRTVLVQGLGTTHSGYFALDVTTPTPDSSAPDDVTKGGPRMLWQLTRDASGNNLFGRGGSTPLITTLFVDPTGGTDPKEIPVAVLPGGPGGTPQAKACPDGGLDFSSIQTDPDFPPRPQVRCYDMPADEAGSRSLTIVRLDDGEILRTFRLHKTDVSSDLQARTTEADLYAPITGQPVAFPGFVGQVSDRIFVGDAEGRLFKVDVSSSNPDDWTMKLFVDLYPSTFKSGDTNAYDAGQPIVLPPTVSVDQSGNLVLAVASGDQDTLAAGSFDTYLYSVTEQADTNRLSVSPKVNWYNKFSKGERVVGPTPVFNKSLFFAAYKPASAGAECDNGSSSIREWDYLTAIDDDPAKGPIRIGPYDDGRIVKTDVEAVTAGVTLTQDPSCSTPTDSTSDPVLGFGHQVGLSSIQPGNFKVVFQTGNLNAGTQGSDVGYAEQQLSPPPTLSRIESWASIVE